MRLSKIFAYRLESLRTIVWAVALVLALQGLSVGIAKARGPSHLHAAPASVLILEDVRRGPQRAAFDSAAHGRAGHSHVVTQRHHHTRSDITVVRDPAMAAHDAAEDGALSLDLVVAGFIALLMLGLGWIAPDLSRRRALRALWQPSFVTARMLDRPPQPA